MSPPGLALMISGNVSASSRRGHQKLWKLEKEDLERHTRRRTQSWSERWLGGGRAGRGPVLRRVKGQRACQKTAEHSSRSCSCKLTWGCASSLGAAAPTDSDAHVTGPKWDEITWGVTAGHLRGRGFSSSLWHPREPCPRDGPRGTTRATERSRQGLILPLCRQTRPCSPRKGMFSATSGHPLCPVPQAPHTAASESLPPTNVRLKGPGDCAVSAQHADQVRKSQTEPATSLKNQNNHCLLWLQHSENPESDPPWPSFRENVRTEKASRTLMTRRLKSLQISFKSENHWTKLPPARVDLIVHATEHQQPSRLPADTHRSPSSPQSPRPLCRWGLCPVGSPWLWCCHHISVWWSASWDCRPLWMPVLGPSR